MALGLYFDNENVSLVSTRKAHGRLELTACYRSMMGDATVREGLDISELGGEVSPELRIVANLQKALREAKITTNEVVFSLPTKELTVRTFRMPKLPKREWDDSIRFEAKKYIPFLIEDVVSTFFVNTHIKGKEMEVLFISCPKKTISKYLSLLKEADLKPVALESEIFSILRIIQPKLKREKANVVAVLKWFGSFGFILILEKGLPRVVRDFSVPSLPQAREDQIPQRLINELRLSFAYYKKEFGEGDVNKIYLCVDELSGGWSDILQKNLNIPVDVLFPFSLIGKPAVPVDNTPISYAALGASLRNLVSVPFQIDLSQEKKVFKYHYEPSRQLKMLFVTGLVAIGALFFLLQSQVAKTSRQLDSTIAQRPKTQLSGDLGVSQLDEFRKIRESKLRTLKNLIDERKFLTAKLEVLVRNLSSGVWVDDFYFTEKVEQQGGSVSDLRITGFAFLQNKEAEINAVNDFVSNLKLDKEFSSVFKVIDLTYIKQVEKSGYPLTTFELRCTQ